MRLKEGHQALVRAITIHPKMVRAPEEGKTLLKSVESNDKLGKGSKRIEKGSWKGMPLYSLTLQERATCNPKCNQWANCFGNNMAFAHRWDHQHEDFLSTLHTELDTLSTRHPDGFAVRLHILGDFFSTDYVDFWRDALTELPMLRVYGYTHWHPGTPIGDAIAAIQSERFVIRWSDRGGELSANVEGEGITCPEQTGKTKSCLTCGLCWNPVVRAIKFLEH